MNRRPARQLPHRVFKRAHRRVAADHVKRRDDQFAFVAAWEFSGKGRDPVLNKEPLNYEEVKMSTRSYK